MITKNTPLKEALKLAAPCKCNACKLGCMYGSGFLAGEDKEGIAKFLSISVEELEKEFLEEVELFNRRMIRPKLIRENNKPYGRCVFYDDEKECTVHDVKPLQCKASINCRDYGAKLSAWFAVNFIVNEDDPESIRQYAQYLKTGGQLIHGASLEELVPDKEKLRKILSYEVLK